MELEGTECSLLIGLTLIVGAKSILKVGMGGGAGGAAAAGGAGAPPRGKSKEEFEEFSWSEYTSCFRGEDIFRIFFELSFFRNFPSF